MGFWKVVIRPILAHFQKICSKMAFRLQPSDLRGNQTRYPSLCIIMPRSNTPPEARTDNKLIIIEQQYVQECTLRLRAVRIRCADHATLLYQQELALNSLIRGGYSVSIFRLRTKGQGVSTYRKRKRLLAYLYSKTCNTPWRSLRVREVEAPTLSGKSAHRWL
jgi:hypothetical protein